MTIECVCAIARSLLLQFGFWRLVLDEAQLVAQSSSVAAQMTSSIYRRHAWTVTGTPIASYVDEIQARTLTGTLRCQQFQSQYPQRQHVSASLI